MILTITLSGYRARHSLFATSHGTHEQPLLPHSMSQNPRQFFPFLAVLLQVSFCLPWRLLPSGAHVNAVLGCLFGSIFNCRVMLKIWLKWNWFVILHQSKIWGVARPDCLKLYKVHCLNQESLPPTTATITVFTSRPF